MSDELRDRIANLIEGLDDQQMIDDGKIASPDDIAQAIIDELGLTHVYRTAYNRDHPDRENQKRVVGKWEKQ